MEDSIIKAFFSLIAIVAVLGVILFFLKKYSKRIKKNNPGGMNLEVVSKIALQPKTYLFVVKAGDKTLLVGANDNSVSAIADLSEPQLSIPQPSLPKTKAFPKELIQNIQTKPSAIKTETTKTKLDTDLSFGSFLKSAFKKN